MFVLVVLALLTLESTRALPTKRDRNNYQTFTSGLGGIYAPAVTTSNGVWYSSGQAYSDLPSALQGSCNYQDNLCQQQAYWQWGWPFDTNDCTNQLSQCNALASPATTFATPSVPTLSVSTELDTITLWATLTQTNAVTQATTEISVVTSSTTVWATSIQTQSVTITRQTTVIQPITSSITKTVVVEKQIKKPVTEQKLVTVHDTVTSQSTLTQPTTVLVSVPTTVTVQHNATITVYESGTSTADAQATPDALVPPLTDLPTSVISIASQLVSGQDATPTATSLAGSETTSAIAASIAASLSASESAAAASVSAAAAAAKLIPTGWARTSNPCVAEGTSGRALIADSTTDPNMTFDMCASFCSAYPLFGIECFCGYNLANGASLDKVSTACDMTCGGNQLAICGGPNALTLFIANNATGLSSDLTSYAVTLPSGWSGVSSQTSTCVQEGTTGRALVGATLFDAAMTIPKCLEYCASQGMQYAGIEYSSQCFCGNAVVNGASLSQTGTCSMPCSGGPGTICGGPNLLSMYTNPSLAFTNTKVAGYALQGCLQEVPGRALNQATLVSADMMVEKCVGYCANGGFAYAGIEYGEQCYCGNSLANGANMALFSVQCNMACAGNSAEICGGPDAISLYSTVQGLPLLGA